MRKNRRIQPLSAVPDYLLIHRYDQNRCQDAERDVHYDGWYMAGLSQCDIHVLEVVIRAM